MSAAFSKKKFKARFNVGKKWEEVIYNKLTDAGIKSIWEEDAWDESVAVMHHTVYDQDIVIPTPDGLVVLEIKSRAGKTRFKDVASFPFDTIIVDTKYGWDKKAIKPHYYINICQHTGGIIVIPHTSKDEWIEGVLYDSYEGKRNRCYMAPISVCKDWDWLIEEINVSIQKQGNKEEDTSPQVVPGDERREGIQEGGQVVDFPEGD